MKISTKGRYALRMLIDLAQNQGEGYIALKDIAARQDISKKYLEQIVPILTKANILKASRGFQGGYRLLLPASEYTLGNILRLTEGNLAPVSCMEGEEVLCARKEQCTTLPIWQGLNKVINAYFDNITLQDVLDEKTL